MDDPGLGLPSQGRGDVLPLPDNNPLILLVLRCCQSRVITPTSLAGVLRTAGTASVAGWVNICTTCTQRAGVKLCVVTQCPCSLSSATCHAPQRATPGSQWCLRSPRR